MRPTPSNIGAPLHHLVGSLGKGTTVYSRDNCHWRQGLDTPETPATATMHAAPMETRGSRQPPWRHQETDRQTGRQADRQTERQAGSRRARGRERGCPASGVPQGAPWRAAGEGPRARGRGEAPQGRAEGRRDARAGARWESGSGSSACPPEAANSRRRTGGAGAPEAGGAVEALPSPRPLLSALGRGRVVGFGLSGSSSAR